MPRKQNGFGSSKSLAFKPTKGVNKGKSVGAAGLYPSNRGYGASVNRSVIEQYNLNSDWVKWRKGFEYYNRAAWYKLETYNPVTEEYEETVLDSVLYQGITDINGNDISINVKFTGYKFATNNADSNNHYVMKRETVSDVDLGKVKSIKNDELLYPDEKLNREILVKINTNPSGQSRLLLRMIGERITDGETEASLNYVLNNKDHPALYIGKSLNDDPVDIKGRFDISGLTGDIQDYVGKIIYVKDFYKERLISDIMNDPDSTLRYRDFDYTFNVFLKDRLDNVQIQILDPDDSVLPPALLDINNLDKLADLQADFVQLVGTYQYDKSLYQRFFGRQNLAASLVSGEVTSLSYTIMPFTILSITPGQNPAKAVFRAVPFKGELNLYTDVTDGTLSFADWSFTKRSLDTYNGEYYHESEKPGAEPWQRIDTDVDPWMDEVFTSGLPLKPATIFTCSCPNHSQAILSAPQETQDQETRKINRQRRYPMPTVKGQDDLTGTGTQQAAGKIESWESREHRMSYKMCKHSIAANFIEHIKIKEPNSYPSLDTRLKFEERLEKEIEEVGERFNASYRRGGITALEVVFALAQGLNLDDVELAYVILNNNF